METITALKEHIAELRTYPHHLYQEDQAAFQLGWQAALDAMEYWLERKQEEIRGKG